MDYLIFFSGLLLIMIYLDQEEEEPTGEEVHLYYYRNDANFNDWKIWIWDAETSSSGHSIDAELVEIEKSRARYIIPLNNCSKIGILPYLVDWKDKDGPDRILDNHDNIAQGHKLYLVEGEKHLRTTKPTIKPPIKNAFLDDKRTIQVQFSRALTPNETQNQLKSLKVISPTGSKIPINNTEISNDGKELRLTLENNLELSDKSLSNYKVYFNGFTETKLQTRGILFDSALNYDLEMGLVVGQELCFRCFTPTAAKVSVLIFDEPGEINDNTEPYRKIPMTEIQPGLWEAHTEKQANMNKYYSFLVEGSDYLEVKQREAQDPYAKLILNLRARAKIFENNEEVAKGPSFDKSETIIYELHLRDFSSDPKGGVGPDGKYSSLAKLNCRHIDHDKLKTGLEHLKELGVNTLQILPTHFFDLDPSTGDYNWGYMPVHYFSLYPGYAEDPHNAVSEFKHLISELHKNGFKIVLDVVINHTAENLYDANSFQALAPGYYYRRNHYGQYFNGSGCGNEFKTEAPMGRKFILDYLKYWADEFQVDGFRFDLMGLLDYETFRLIDHELKKINPEILLYGEPWAADNAGVPVLGKGAQKDTSFSVFNDHYRDALRGDNSSHGKGFVQGESLSEKIAHGFYGSIHDFCSSPLESINYAACHDNYTLRDKLELSSGYTDEKTLQKMERITAILLLTSQGIPLIHNGQEFGRSKQHNHNSYNAPISVNQITWEDKKTRHKLFEFHKRLIELRLQHRVFRMDDRALIDKNLKWIRNYSEINVPNNVVIFQIHSEGLLDSFKEVYVIINASDQNFEIQAPTGQWKQVLRNDKVWTKINKMPDLAIESLMTIPPKECLIIAQINK